MVARDWVENSGRLLGVVVPADRVVQRGEQLVLIVVVEALHFCRPQALSEKMINGAQQEGGVVREFLRRILAAARHDDGREIVRAEVALDEFARLTAHDGGAQRRDIEVVEQDDVNATR